MTATTAHKPTRKQLIRIAVHRSLNLPVEAKEIEAYVYGPLALHEIQYGWTITHLRTGLRVMEVLDKKALAVEVMEVLVSEGDWEFGEFGGGGVTREHWERNKLARDKANHLADPENWNEDGTRMRR